MNRAMKDSGIPWIGEIPEGWEICRLKDCGFLYGGLTGKSGDDFNVEEEDNYALFIPFTNIYNNLYINPNDLRKVKIGVNEQQNQVKRGDLLFLMSSEDTDGIGKSSLLKDCIVPLYLNSFCKGFHITNKKVNPVYLNFLLTSEILRELIRVEARGFIRINLRQDRLSCVPIMLPPLAEQEAIAAFLDRKCGEVDEMVSLQEQVIEELKAYKQSVITEAVTKGLNPTAPMKPTNIDWIGQIPTHWEKQQFRRIFIIQKRIAGSLDYDVLSVTQGGLKVKDLSKNEGQMAQDYSKYQIVGVNDYVMNHMDLITGFVDCSKQIGVTSPDYRVFHAIDESQISLSYYLRIFQTCYKERIFYHLGQGVSGMGRWRLPAEQLKLFYLPLPPLSEQREIADFLDRKCADIDALIALKQQKIEDLKQYKKSLIYEYVTGKKQV